MGTRSCNFEPVPSCETNRHPALYGEEKQLLSTCTVSCSVSLGHSKIWYHGLLVYLLWGDLEVRGYSLKRLVVSVSST